MSVSTELAEPMGEQVAPRRSWWRRPRLVVAGVLVAVAATTLVVTQQQGFGEPSLPGAEGSMAPPLPWLSGASGIGVASGEFAAWRGRPVQIAGTWADDVDGSVALPQLRPGGEYASWDQSLDIALGAIGEGETWAEAANGAYESRWRTSLENLRQLWGDRDGTLFIRFAHEMNGNWYPWSVDQSAAADFEVAWDRFRALQTEILPEAELVFCVNGQSVGTGMDWREFFPGAEAVDVLAVDYYNNFPYVETADEWDRAADATDEWGGPRGIEAHRVFAQSVGLPLAVPEWSGNADEGDAPVFMEQMYDFFAAHAGNGPGEVPYDVLFNVDMSDSAFTLFDADVRLPESAAAYRRLW